MDHASIRPFMPPKKMASRRVEGSGGLRLRSANMGLPFRCLPCDWDQIVLQTKSLVVYCSVLPFYWCLLLEKWRMSWLQLTAHACRSDALKSVDALLETVVTSRLSTRRMKIPPSKRPLSKCDWRVTCPQNRNCHLLLVVSVP